MRCKGAEPLRRNSAQGVKSSQYQGARRATVHRARVHDLHRRLRSRCPVSQPSTPITIQQDTTAKQQRSQRTAPPPITGIRSNSPPKWASSNYCSPRGGQRKNLNETLPDRRDSPEEGLHRTKCAVQIVSRAIYAFCNNRLPCCTLGRYAPFWQKNSANSPRSGGSLFPPGYQLTAWETHTINQIDHPAI